jgi:hypothetical protein
MEQTGGTVCGLWNMKYTKRKIKHDLQEENDNHGACSLFSSHVFSSKVPHKAFSIILQKGWTYSRE